MALLHQKKLSYKVLGALLLGKTNILRTIIFSIRKDIKTVDQGFVIKIKGGGRSLVFPLRNALRESCYFLFGVGF